MKRAAGCLQTYFMNLCSSAVRQLAGRSGAASVGIEIDAASRMQHLARVYPRVLTVV
jgi:hypothetical protein